MELTNAPLEKLDRPLHVLMVHNDYARYSGEEEAVDAIAGMLQRRGHRVSWMRRSSAGLDRSLTQRIAAAGAGVWSASAQREMRSLLARDRPDIVQVQNIYPLISASIFTACSEAALPVVMRCPNYRLFCPTGLHLRKGVVCERCLGGAREINCVVGNCEGSILKSAGYALRGALNRITRVILNNVDQFIVLSEFQRRRFDAAGIPSSKLSVLPNIAYGGSDSGLILPRSNEVLFVGRVSPEKGIDDFLELARRIPARPFLVAGNVAGREELLRKAPENVTFAGFLDQSSLDALFARVAVMVCPSKWFEGFPNVIARAMAHGCPVVAYRVGALPEIVRNGATGLTVELGNVIDLQRAVLCLLEDASLRESFGARARRDAAEWYSEETVYRRLIEIYDSAFVSATHRYGDANSSFASHRANSQRRILPSKIES